MKNIIIVVLLLVAVAVGGMWFQKRCQATQAEARLEALQKEAAELQGSIAQREEGAASLREKLEKSMVESAVNAGQAAQLSQALTNRLQAAHPPEVNAKPANPFAEMFKNPEMREMIKQQQQTAMVSIIEKNYADFLKTQPLSPEQASTLKDLITRKMTVGADLGMEMMSGELTAEQRTDLTKRIKTDTDAVTGEIKDFLGADNYAAFETYEKSLPDRMAVSGFKDQLAGGEMALKTDQEQQLIQAMSQEREGFKFTADYSNPTSPTEDLFSQFTEDKLTIYFQEQEQLNQRYLARAQTILSAEQYAAYQKSLTAQQEMAKMGMKMAAQMFNTKKGTP
jgi:hypothetical protein